jgi:hypothetical protein
MYRYLLLIFTVFITSCSNGQDKRNIGSTGELIFQSGFEPGSKVINRNGDADIIGTDKSFVDHNDWVNDFDNHPDIGNFNLQYQGGDSTIWSEKNNNIKVPVSKWFTLDLYYKEGNSSTGKFYLSMTPEGGMKQVIFDLTKFTHNTEDPHPVGVGDFNPIKLYTSKGLIDFMKSQGKTLQIFWDDYKLWKGRGQNL